MWCVGIKGVGTKLTSESNTCLWKDRFMFLIFWWCRLPKSFLNNIWRMIVWCVVMLFPYELFSYMPEKRAYSAWWRHWVFVEYEGRNKTVEEYFKRIMLFGKTLKGQSWKETEKVYGKDKNWRAIRVRWATSNSTHQVAASTKFQATRSGSHHLQLMDRYFSCICFTYSLVNGLIPFHILLCGGPLSCSCG